MHYRTKEKERSCPSKIHTSCRMSEYHVKLILSLRKWIAPKVYLNFLSIFLKDMQEFNQEVGKPSQRMLFVKQQRATENNFSQKARPILAGLEITVRASNKCQIMKLIFKMFLNWPKQRVKTNTWRHMECRVLRFASEIQMCGYRMIKSLFINMKSQSWGFDCSLVAKKRQLGQIQAALKYPNYRKQHSYYTPLQIKVKISQW